MSDEANPASAEASAGKPSGPPPEDSADLSAEAAAKAETLAEAGQPTEALRLDFGEVQAQSQQQEREFAISLYQLVKLGLIYDLDNEVLREPFAAVLDQTRKLGARSPFLAMQFKENNLFLNRKLVKFRSRVYEMVLEMIKVFALRGVGGLLVGRDLDRRELTAFLEALRQARKDTPENLFQKIRDQLKAGGVKSIRILSVAEVSRDDVRPALAADQLTFVKLTYAKAVVLIRELYLNVGNRRYVDKLTPKIRRGVQDLVTMGTTSLERLVGLAAIKNPEEYLFSHSVNVSILSIVLGHRLGLSRYQLGELGLAGIYHDLGKALVPAPVLDKQGPLSPGERETVRRHPFLAVSCFIKSRMITESLLLRMITAFEYNIRANGYPEVPEKFQPLLFSRIVAIADVFDALTTARPWRPAFLPDEALKMMYQDIGRRFEEPLLKTFVAAVGVYPLGTLVVLDSGELGVVVHNAGGAGARRPVVKIVRDAGGQAVDGELADLTEKDEAGAFRRSIERTDDPLKYDINIPAYLLA